MFQGNYFIHLQHVFCFSTYQKIFSIKYRLYFYRLSNNSLFRIKIECWHWMFATTFHFVLLLFIFNASTCTCYGEKIFKSMWVGNGIATKKMIWSCVSLLSLIAFEFDSLPLFFLPFSKDTVFALACVGIHMNVLKSVNFWFMHVYVKT